MADLDQQIPRLLLISNAISNQVRVVVAATRGSVLVEGKGERDKGGEVEEKSKGGSGKHHPCPPLPMVRIIIGNGQT